LKNNVFAQIMLPTAFTAIATAFSLVSTCRWNEIALVHLHSIALLI
jgi:ABC-type glycerol-3-phosphate transport system permease component